MATRRRWKGDKTFRRIMKNLPEAMHVEMEEVLVDGARDIRRMMAARAPRRTGALASGIQYRVLRKALSAKIGLIGTPRGRAKLFYGRILDLGRKAQTVKVTRKANVNPYLMRVRAISPMRFVTGRFTDARIIMTRRLKGIFDRAIKHIAGGSDD